MKTLNKNLSVLVQSFPPVADGGEGLWGHFSVVPLSTFCFCRTPRKTESKDLIIYSEQRMLETDLP